DRIQYVFDRHPAPVLRVVPGEVFEIETEDARTGKTRTPETTTPEYVKSLRSKATYYGNPVTGPLWIDGASPGDTLAVHLHAIDCDTASSRTRCRRRPARTTSASPRVRWRGASARPRSWRCRRHPRRGGSGATSTCRRSVRGVSSTCPSRCRAATFTWATAIRTRATA